MPLEEENELIRVRREKLDRLREAGQDPFAAERYDRTHSAADAVRLFQEREGIEGAEPVRARLGVRILQRRIMGKAAFFDLHDESGRIQLYFKVDHVGPDRFAQLDLVDQSDIIGAE